jgi:hypothetical protein
MLPRKEVVSIDQADYRATLTVRSFSLMRLGNLGLRCAKSQSLL